MPERVLFDREFAREVGISAEITPRLSAARKFILVTALLLASATSIFAALFHSGNATGSSDFQTSATQCPMTGTPKPSR